MPHLISQWLTPVPVASASPTTTTVVPPRSSSKGPASADDPPRNPSKSSATAEDGAAPAGEPKKKRSLLNIPRSNSQSNESQTPTGTGLSGATVADSESIGRGSKRSFLGKRRAGSTASSKRSQQQPAASEKTAQPPPVPTPENRAGSTRSKTKKSGGLLSCLPCFAPKEDRSTRDEAPAENAKQAAKVKPVRTTQPTPVKKQDPTAESSTADSKEPLDEKAAGETYGADRLEKAHGDGTAERPAHDVPPTIVTRSSSKKQSTEQPLPPLPNQPGTLQTGHPQISIQTPTPGTTPVQPRPSHEQQQIIHDRTDSQEEKDQDIEMKDVPLAASDVRHEGDESSSEAKTEIPPKVDLPPPPPLEQRRDAVRDQTSETSLSEPQQKYLLGPLRPEFKGKKCLVLDLDETLVHSSFKVRFSSVHTLQNTDNCLDTCSSGFHHTCGD